jgi:flagellar hook-associated protein 1 FlgK
MSLSSALSISGTGINAIESQLALISQNVANASTPNYSSEVGATADVTAGGQGMGVVQLPSSRTLDSSLQASVLTQNATVAAAQVSANALSAINATQGAPGSGDDLASLLGDVTNAFTTLADNPPSSADQQSVVTAAQNLTQGINTLSQTYQAQRQTAQDTITTDITSINQTLSNIGALSDQIINLKSLGQSTADLENQRDAAVATLSSLVSVKTLAQPDGDLTVVTSAGVTLPTHTATPLATHDATLGPAATYPGGIPAITLNGVDITSQLTNSGGGLGANLTLRDQTLPTYQGELDEFSNQLSNRFAAQGLTLFTDPAGNLPASTGPNTQSGYVGYAGEITVNPAVAADPSMVRDGTNDVAGSATGASAFTVNPAGGPASFTTLINRVLTYAVGGQAQQGVPQPTVPATGLGANGNLNASYSGQTDLTNLAAALVAAQSNDSAQATTQSTTEAAVQTTMSAKLSSEDGVNMDAQLAQMTVLQNAYGANARIIAAVQSMFSSLLTAVTPG